MRKLQCFPFLGLIMEQIGRSISSDVITAGNINDSGEVRNIKVSSEVLKQSGESGEVGGVSMQGRDRKSVTKPVEKNIISKNQEEADIDDVINSNIDGGNVETIEKLENSPVAKAAQAHVEVALVSQEEHEKRMEKAFVLGKGFGDDPSVYGNPRVYRMNVNTKLKQRQSPFLLGEKFFVNDNGSTAWRGEKRIITCSKEELENFNGGEGKYLQFKDDEQKAMYVEMNKLWPAEEDNKEKGSFAEFVFRKYGNNTRFQQVSKQERQLLKNIIVQTKKLVVEHDKLEAKKNSRTNEEEAWLMILKSVLTNIKVIVSGHENVCAGRLQEIVRIAAEEVDIAIAALTEEKVVEFSKLSDVATVEKMINMENENTVENIVKKFLVRYRADLCKKVTDVSSGTFFKTDKEKIDGSVYKFSDMQRVVREKAGKAEDILQKTDLSVVREGLYDWIQNAVGIVAANVWNVNVVKVQPNREFTMLPGLRIKYKELVNPFVEQLTIPSIVEFARKDLVLKGAATRDELAKAILSSKVSFNEYCEILGKNQEEFKRFIENEIQESGKLNDPNIALLNKWKDNPDGTDCSLQEVLDAFAELDDEAYVVAEKLVPELTSVSTDSANQEDAIAQLFPILLYHSGALVHTEDVSLPQAEKQDAA